MLGELFTRRLLIVLGKGGVGKTTLCAALARVGAASGTQAIVMECDSRASRNALFGVVPKFEPFDAGNGVSVALLDGRQALEEYLRLVVPGRALLHAVFASRLYQFFIQAAPGIKELMMLGKVCYELERRTDTEPFERGGGRLGWTRHGEGRRARRRQSVAGREDRTSTRSRRWGLIIVDAPASGQALSLLRMPSAARQTFGESIVGREADNIGRTLRDSRTTAIIQVTTPEALAVSETLETFDALADMKLKPRAILFNRHVPVEFDELDIASLTDAAAVSAPRSHLKELARAELARRRAGEEALSMLRERTRVPVIEVRDYAGMRPAGLVERLAADLALRVDAESAGSTTRGAS
jgi:anion-transporting  ArsA/GET3 family ATPase